METILWLLSIAAIMALIINNLRYMGLLDLAITDLEKQQKIIKDQQELLKDANDIASRAVEGLNEAVDIYKNVTKNK